MTIKEAAEITGISIDNLRYYERIGLIPKVPRTSSGIRNYDEMSLHWIEFAMRFKRAGVPLESIHEYIQLALKGESTKEARREILLEAEEKLEEIVSQIHNIVGGDIIEIQAANPYPKEYEAAEKQAKQEIESSYKTALKTKIDNSKSYDVIFLGSPIWWGTIAPPVATFLSEYDLSGKTIVPFVTHGGSGRAQSSTDIAKFSLKSTVL